MTGRALDRCRHAEARLWTGPAAHLFGGGLDFLGALARYAVTRLRERIAR